MALGDVKTEGTVPWFPGPSPGLSGLWHQHRGFLWAFSLERRREDTGPSDGCERLKWQKFIQRVRHKLDSNPKLEHGLLSLSLFAVPHGVSVARAPDSHTGSEGEGRTFFFFPLPRLDFLLQLAQYV